MAFCQAIFHVEEHLFYLINSFSDKRWIIHPDSCISNEYSLYWNFWYASFMFPFFSPFTCSYLNLVGLWFFCGWKIIRLTNLLKNWTFISSWIFSYPGFLFLSRKVLFYLLSFAIPYAVSGYFLTCWHFPRFLLLFSRKNEWKTLHR